MGGRVRVTCIFHGTQTYHIYDWLINFGFEPYFVVLGTGSYMLFILLLLSYVLPQYFS